MAKSLVYKIGETIFRPAPSTSDESAIALTAQWVPETGSGSGLFIGGIILKDGDLLATDIDKVRIERNNVEIPCFVKEETRALTYYTGCVRVLHVQFNVVETLTPDTPLEGVYRLVFGNSTRTTTDLTETALPQRYTTSASATNYRNEGFPNIHVHPTSVSYMCEASTDALLEVEADTETNPPGAWYQRIEDHYYRTGPSAWPNGCEIDNWFGWDGGTNSAMHWGPDLHTSLAFFKSGNIRYFRHACAYTGRQVHERMASGAGPSTTFTEPFGAVYYYWQAPTLDGRTWCNRIAQDYPSSQSNWDFIGSSGDGRYATRISQYLLLGYIMNFGGKATRQNVLNRLTLMIDEPLPTVGALVWTHAQNVFYTTYGYTGAWGPAHYSGHCNNFYLPNLAFYFDLHWRLVEEDSRIPVKTREMCLYMRDSPGGPNFAGTGQRHDLHPNNAPFATPSFFFRTDSFGHTVHLCGIYPSMFYMTAEWYPAERQEWLDYGDIFLELVGLLPSGNFAGVKSGPDKNNAKVVNEVYGRCWDAKAKRVRVASLLAGG